MAQAPVDITTQPFYKRLNALITQKTGIEAAYRHTVASFLYTSNWLKADGAIARLTYFFQALGKPLNYELFERIKDHLNLLSSLPLDAHNLACVEFLVQKIPHLEPARRTSTYLHALTILLQNKPELLENKTYLDALSEHQEPAKLAKALCVAAPFLALPDADQKNQRLLFSSSDPEALVTTLNECLVLFKFARFRKTLHDSHVQTIGNEKYPQNQLKKTIVFLQTYQRRWMMGENYQIFKQVPERIFDIMQRTFDPLWTAERIMQIQDEGLWEDECIGIFDRILQEYEQLPKDKKRHRSLYLKNHHEEDLPSDEESEMNALEMNIDCSTEEQHSRFKAKFETYFHVFKTRRQASPQVIKTLDDASSSWGPRFHDPKGKKPDTVEEQEQPIAQFHAAAGKS